MMLETETTVLVVEDEDGVRRLVTKVLESRGYVVHAAGHPRDALAFAGTPGLKLDLLVTDVELPETGGREVARTIKSRHPDCRILFMSGYTDDAIVRYGVLNAEALFLQKPFKVDALLQKVAAALAGSTLSR